MIAATLNKLIAGEHLSQSEAAALLTALISEETTDAQIAAILVALASKGESDEELAGFAATMRERAQRVTTKHSRFLDTCGTGGSSAKTFNVSTASALVIAAAGVPVAKHGNVGVTSKAGSADVLRALGITVETSAESVSASLETIGIGFMFAPLHHGATKRVAQVRRALGIRTIFNLLGPLTNPAGAPFQLIGVSDQTAVKRVAHALERLGTQRSWVVRGNDGLDEITLSGTTTVFETSTGSVREFEISPEDFGLSRSPMDTLRGGTADENASLIQQVLKGTRGDTALDIILANAGAGLFIAGESESLREGVEKARSAIESGAAWRKLEEMREFNRSATGFVA